MPAVVRARAPHQAIVVPRRVADALRPEHSRADIPTRVTLASGAPPFAGELREEQSSNRIRLGPNSSTALVTLRRPWLYVGWVVDPGNVLAPGLNVRLRILTRGLNGLTTPIAVLAGSPHAVTNLTVGALCELVIENPTGSPVTNVQATIWGMGER